jgi:exonuclease III
MGAHRDAVHKLVSDEHPSVVCLQETKTAVLSDFDVIQLLRLGFDYAFLPAEHALGVFW